MGSNNGSSCPFTPARSDRTGSQRTMKKASIAVFEALSHPMRIRMIELCGRKERRIEELSQTLDINASSINHHLTVLRESGLLLTERRGKPAYYSIDKKLLRAALDDLSRSTRLDRLEE
jgi:DNA-binding transcriptional ArsR family regulator